MAGWRVHVFGGAIFSIILLCTAYLKPNLWGNLSWIDYLIILPIVFIFSILPDIDLENAKITTLSYFFGITFNLVVVFLYFFNLIDFKYVLYVAIFLFVINFFVRMPHRGFPHSLTSALLFSLPLWWIFSWQIALIGFVSYWSHLWLDVYHSGKLDWYPFRLWGKIR